MNCEIRKSQIKDVDSIARFQILMADETEGKRLDSIAVDAGVRAVFADPSKGFYLVATNDGQVIASLLITFEWSDWRNNNLWYIQSVFVAAEFRSQGVFKKLYQAVVRLARENQVQHLRLYVEHENDRAQNVYEALGMEQLPYRMYVADISKS